MFSRLWRSRGRTAVTSFAVTLLATSGAALTACTGGHPAAFHTPSAAVSTPGATASATASGSSSTSPGNAPKGSQAWWIAQLPTFGPMPAPQQTNVNAGSSSPLWFKVPTTQRVAFLTIDDGALQLPDALALLKASGVRVTLFLTVNFVRDHVAYFKALQQAGAVIEDHTITHTSLRGTSEQFQHHEICDAADELGQLFGRRPTLFRPPFGNYDDTTLAVARSCGLKVVFYWTETVNEGIVRYQTANHHLMPGHILLMHFRPAYDHDFVSALQHMRADGLQPALLEDYITGACPTIGC